MSEVPSIKIAETQSAKPRPKRRPAPMGVGDYRTYFWKLRVLVDTAEAIGKPDYHSYEQLELLKTSARLVRELAERFRKDEIERSA